MPTVMINGKKHTPSSGTLKKMKARAAAEAAAKKATPKAATPKAKTMKAPIPATRKGDGKPQIKANVKAPIPMKMPEGIKNKRTNTMFTRGKMDPNGGL
jgi:hypothetical protein